MTTTTTTQQLNIAQEREKTKTAAAKGDGWWTSTVTTMMRANARGRKDEEHVAIEGRRSRQGQQHDGQQRQTKQHNYQKVHIHLCYNLVVDCSHPCSTRYYFRCTDPNIYFTKSAYNTYNIYHSTHGDNHTIRPHHHSPHQQLQMLLHRPWHPSRVQWLQLCLSFLQ